MSRLPEENNNNELLSKIFKFLKSDMFGTIAIVLVSIITLFIASMINSGASFNDVINNFEFGSISILTFSILIIKILINNHAVDTGIKEAKRESNEIEVLEEEVNKEYETLDIIKSNDRLSKYSKEIIENIQGNIRNNNIRKWELKLTKYDKNSQKYKVIQNKIKNIKTKIYKVKFKEYRYTDLGVVKKTKTGYVDGNALKYDASRNTKAETFKMGTISTLFFAIFFGSISMNTLMSNGSIMDAIVFVLTMSVLLSWNWLNVRKKAANNYKNTYKQTLMFKLKLIDKCREEINERNIEELEK